MKIISRNARVRTEDPLGHGLEAGIVVILFALGGYWLDQTVGTTPLFTIAFTTLGAIGLFAKLKYSYDARMDELQARRFLAQPTESTSGPTAASTSGPAAESTADTTTGSTADGDHAA